VLSVFYYENATLVADNIEVKQGETKLLKHFTESLFLTITAELTAHWGQVLSNIEN
jgi:hypothetical protein